MDSKILLVDKTRTKYEILQTVASKMSPTLAEIIKVNNTMDESDGFTSEEEEDGSDEYSTLFSPNTIEIVIHYMGNHFKDKESFVMSKPVPLNPDVNELILDVGDRELLQNITYEELKDLINGANHFQISGLVELSMGYLAIQLRKTSSEIQSFTEFDTETMTESKKEEIETKVPWFSEIHIPGDIAFGVKRKHT